VLPACAALALLSYMTGSGARIDEELHLIAPAQVPPGSALPVRVHFYTDLDAIEGARLAQPAVTAVLLDSGGKELARAGLRPGLGGSLEGSLPAPPAPPAPTQLEHALRVETRIGERSVAVQAPLRFGVPRRALAPEPRTLRALQGQALGSVEPLGAAVPPAALALRVAGGACVPEAPCVLHVHMGEPAAGLKLVPSASAEALEAPPALETAGVVTLRVKVHGPEAYLTLLATRAGQPVARRRVRLPVALGAGALQLASRLLDAPARPQLALGPDGGPCLVDALQDGQWLRSATSPDCGAPAAAPFAALGPGLWRLQARRDPFAADAAGVAVVHVRRAGQSAAERLAEIAQAAHGMAGADAFVRGVLAEPAAYAGALESSAGYLLAVLEDGLVPQPAPHSSMPAARARLAVERERVRGAALWVLGLSGLTLVLLLVRRGLTAAEQAGDLMREAGEAPAELQRHRLRRVATVALSAVLLALAFVAIALYVRLRS
jgi:hypothetical protein